MSRWLLANLLVILLSIPATVGNCQSLPILGPRPLAKPELGRGVNFGNMLEAPNEGDWGLFVEDVFFDKAVEAGFNHIRLPVSWTHHAQSLPPYTIDSEFMDRVEYVVDEALSHGLKVLLNNHHYDELNDNPLAEWDRALMLWQQIAIQFQDRPSEQLYFEILNEPHGQFNDQPELWNQFMVMPWRKFGEPMSLEKWLSVRSSGTLFEDSSRSRRQWMPT